MSSNMRLGEGDDTISDFNTGNTGTLSDGDSSRITILSISERLLRQSVPNFMPIRPMTVC